MRTTAEYALYELWSLGLVLGIYALLRITGVWKHVRNGFRGRDY